MTTTNEHTEREELKPCPFCGSSDVANVSAGQAGPSDRWHAGDKIFAVNCRSCGASVPNRYRNALVVAAWNQRAALLEAQRPALKPLTDKQIAAVAVDADCVWLQREFACSFRAIVRATEAAHGIKEQA